MEVSTKSTRQTSSHQHNHFRAVTLFVLEVYDDDKLIGQGYVMRDAFHTSTPILSDMGGNGLPDKWYDLRVTDSYLCVINSMVH